MRGKSFAPATSGCAAAAAGNMRARTTRRLLRNIDFSGSFGAQDGGIRRTRFRLEEAKIIHYAAWTFRLARLAGVAAMQDQPVMRMQPVFLRHALQQLQFDLERVLARREAGAVADAEDVGVYRDGR